MDAAHEVVARRGSAVGGPQMRRRRFLFDQGQLRLVVAIQVGEVAQRHAEPERARPCGRGVDESAPAALRREEAVAGQQVHRLAHGHARDAELFHQLLDRGQHAAGGPHAAGDPSAKQVRELGVSRNGAIAEDAGHGLCQRF
jgi:hypothetical protein